jgi:hypothetical protein
MSSEDTESKSVEDIGSYQLMTLLALAEVAAQLSPRAIARLRALPKLEKPITLERLSVALWDIDDALSDETPYRDAYSLLQRARPERVQLDDATFEERQPGDEGGSHGIEPLGELVDLAQHDPTQLARKVKWLDRLRDLLGMGGPAAKSADSPAGEQGQGTEATGNGGS